MSIVTIEEVRKTVLDQAYFRGGNVDIPAAGTTTDYYTLEIAGWWVAKEADRPCNIEVLYQGSLQAETGLNVGRWDVITHFAPRPIPERSGFSLTVNTTNFAPRFELAVELVFEDGERRPWATIQGCQQPLAPAFQPDIQALMVYGLGRSGTTLFMQLVGWHPEIVIEQHFPYETRSALYWLHQARVLATPSTDPDDSGRLHQYFMNSEAVRRNPFNQHPFIDRPAVREWYGNEYTNDLFAFSLQSIEKFYRRVALDQGKPAVRYFAEKASFGPMADWSSQMVWELYPGSKEIFLVRDFRDQFCSTRSFRMKKGRDLAMLFDGMTVEEFINYNRRRLNTLRQNWQHRQSRAFLLHYEDLVLRPQETLAAIYNYLEVDYSPALVEKTLAHVAVETHDTRQHKTTASVGSSIGRWKTDLDEPLKALINDRLGESLAAFGYEV